MVVFSKLIEQKLVAMLKLIVDLYQEVLVIGFTCVLRLIIIKIDVQKTMIVVRCFCVATVCHTMNRCSE